MATKRALSSKQKYPQEIKDHELSLKRKIQSKNSAQSYYISCLENETITFGVGPAGTGKTFLAVGVALKKLITNEVSRLVITRPVVEAGEKLGFLPGSLEEKIHPYLLPIVDSIEDWIGPTKTKQLFAGGKIEVAPLAYMRGRTFNDSFLILDEAQNATVEQMRMFLTRFGYGSFVAVNGDLTQSDLPIAIRENGLKWASRKLSGKLSNICVVNFKEEDIVRHPLITDILKHLDAPDPRVANLKHNGGINLQDQQMSLLVGSA
ncbi:MAG: PhoH family protein [Candidatus Nitrosotenuis sp.]